MGVVRQESATEYFKPLVESALSHQRIETGELTSFYLVNLLCEFVSIEPARCVAGPEPLATRLVRALDAGGAQRRLHLRSLGDVALFVAGVFSDSLSRKVVDIDYYVSMGEYAYGSLSRAHTNWFTPVFAELAGRFVSFVDVLGEVSERSALTASGDLLRAYERWLRTGSPRDRQRLVERGVVPHASIGHRFLQ